jgi:FAD/FMN-containing dehydrogenase/Fe-S oxidoreductase
VSLVILQPPRTIDAQRLESALRQELAGEVRFDNISRALYSTDASIYQIPPVGVVIPKTREDIIRAVDIARRCRCPVTMRGGGTSQAGQAIGEGLQIDTSKYYNQILELNVAGRWVRVEPGVVLDELNAFLKPHALRFAPDISTASRATIGGMMANNSAGARSLMYGKTIDHVLEQTVLFADGSVAHLRDLTPAELDRSCSGRSIPAEAYRTVRRLASELASEIDRRYPKILRRVGGYNLDEFVHADRPFNLSRMMVGSEGTLGVVLDAKLSLVPLPKAKAVLVIEFAGLLEALAATPSILNHRPSAVEVMDKFILDHAAENPSLDHQRRLFMSGDAGALLCVEFYADRDEDLPPRLQALESDLRRHDFGYRYFHATELGIQAKIWGFREACLGLSMAMRDDNKSLSFVEDTAVTPERLRDFIDRFLGIIRKHETVAGVYAHASVGCLHVRPVVNLKTASGVRKLESIANDVADLVLEFGGALSGEHGDGLVRSPFMEKMFGPVLYEAFRAIKRAFDPENLFNPGKIVDAPPLTANLRYGAGYRTANPATFFDYSGYGGFAQAVEMCSGVGACRKKLDGTMCPSFMATRDEKHSTRGRSNVLRLAMNGRLGEAAMDDSGIKQVLDLCLECRACRSECPVGVDMARYKSEFLAGYWRRHGTSLQARILGHAHFLAALGSQFAPLANWSVRNRVLRGWMEQMAGIDRRRSLPAWSNSTWRERFPARFGPAAAYLFADTFTNYYDPEPGLAAERVLRAAGLATGLAPNVCCGRPLISQGLLDEARRLAESNVVRLSPIAKAGQPILFCEPSCLSAVREDVPELLRHNEQADARLIAGRAMMVEDFLESELAAGRRSLPLRGGTGRLLLHAHCHQRSMGLLAPLKALLERTPGYSVVDLDAGCCGMAGSFGYARERYEVSIAIAERKLLPAARSMQPGDVLVGAGFSCRHQVEDLAGVTLVHPMVFLEQHLLSELPKDLEKGVPR